MKQLILAVALGVLGASTAAADTWYKLDGDFVEGWFCETRNDAVQWHKAQDSSNTAMIRVLGNSTCHSAPTASFRILDREYPFTRVEFWFDGETSIGWIAQDVVARYTS